MAAATRGRTRTRRGLVALTASVVLLAAALAWADIYVVDTTTDLPDSDILDSVCNDGTGRCSLRAAIEQSNEHVGRDDVHFSIGGGGLQTIQPTSGLPPIADAEGLFIDATTQPGYTGTPLIELNGSLAGAVSGLRVTLGHSGIDGLNIHSFAANGIVLQGSHTTYVRRCFLGTDPTGMVARGNGAYGIYILTSEKNWIGRPGEGNLIAGNTTYNVYIRSQANSNEIKGNLIGTNRTATATLGTPSRAVLITDSSNNLIGGPAGEDNVIGGAFLGVEVTGVTSVDNIVAGNSIGNNGTASLPNFTGISIRDSANTVIGSPLSSSVVAGNVIAGNLQYGLTITGASATGTVVTGNKIGVASDGVTPMANGLDGIQIQGLASSTTIGGAVTEMNIIAHNGGTGVAVYSGTANSIRRNSIYANTDQAIDLDADGVTANDADDTDVGANDRQNFPENMTATATCMSTDIGGLLRTIAGSGVEIDFYSVDGCDTSGYGEARRYLGTISGIADASGAFPFNSSLPVLVDPATEQITATATDSLGNTSELSGCVIAVDDCASACSVGAIAAITRVMAVKALNDDDVELSWSPDGSADDGYNVAYSTVRTDIPACGICLGAFPVVPCRPTGSELATTCVHVGAISNTQSPVFYYEVRGVCSGQEAGQ